MKSVIKKAGVGACFFCNGSSLEIHPNIDFKNSDGREAVMNFIEVFAPAKYPSFWPGLF